MAVRSPTVTPMATDKSVTRMVATIIGRIPYSAGFAYRFHSVPQNESQCRKMNGNPFANRKTVMVRSARTEKDAAIVKTARMTFSFTETDFSVDFIGIRYQST